VSSTEAETPVQAVFERLRGPAAVLFVAVNGFLLLVGLLSILTSSLDLTDALATARGWFLGLGPALLPALALVLVAVVRPAKDKLVPLVSLAAVVELGFAALFGLITMLSTFASGYSAGSSFVAFLEGLGWLALVGGVFFFALQTLLAARGAAPKGAAAYGQGGYPGGPYGQQQPGQHQPGPDGWPGQPQPGQSQPGQSGQGHQEWPSAGQPGQGQPPQGQPQQGQPGQGQPEWGQPAQSGQPTQGWAAQPAWPGQQPAQPGQWPSQAPTSGQPAYNPPSSGVPYGQPSSGVPYGAPGQPSSGVPYGGPGGAYPAQQPGYGSAHSAAPTSGFPQPTSGYPAPSEQHTNVVNVNDLLPPDQGGYRPPRHGDGDR